MKKAFTAFACTLAAVAGVSAQSFVTMKAPQNPVFQVSVDRVDVTLTEDGILLGGDVVVEGGSGIYSYRWYTPSGAELGTDRTLQVNKEGTYCLDVSDTCDCLHTVNFNITSASVSEVKSEDFSVTPSPTSGALHIIGFEPVRYALVDMSGRLVKVEEYNRPVSDIDISGCAPGNYLLTLSNASGHTVTCRIIKI